MKWKKRSWTGRHSDPSKHTSWKCRKNEVILAASVRGASYKVVVNWLFYARDLKWEISRLDGPAFYSFFVHSDVELHRLRNAYSPRSLEKLISKYTRDIKFYVNSFSLKKYLDFPSSDVPPFPQLTAAKIVSAILKSPKIWQKGIGLAKTLGIMNDELLLLEKRMSYIDLLDAFRG